MRAVANVLGYLLEVSSEKPQASIDLRLVQPPAVNVRMMIDKAASTGLTSYSHDVMLKPSRMLCDPSCRE
jgi:hypothetical protein